MADILTTERQTLKFRLLAVLAVGVAFIVAGTDGNATGIVVISLFYLLYCIGLHALLPRWSPPALVFGMIIVDAIFLGAAYYWSGQAANLVLVLFPLLVPFYAVYGTYAPCTFAATAMLVSLFLSQVASGRSATTATFLAQIPLFYLLAALSGYLAQGRIRRLEEQQAMQRLVHLEEGARSLSGAVRTIQEAVDLATSLQELAQLAPALTGLPECLIGLLDRKSGALITRASTTARAVLGVDRLDYLVEWPQDGSLTNEVLAFHEPVAVRRTGDDTPTLPPWAERLHIGAMLGLPLSSRGVDVGVMFFYGVAPGHAFTAQEVMLGHQFADIVAMVAVNAQLYEDVQTTIATVISELHPVVLPKPDARARRLPQMEIGDLLVDIPKKQAKISGKGVNLTPTEFDLLAVLAENSGHAVDQDTLLRRVWGEDYNGRSTVVDVGMHRLRRKIEEGPGGPRRIVTVRGRGYMLVPGVLVGKQGE